MVNETRPMIASHLALLDQGLDLIARLDDATFRASSPLAPGGTVGRHFRHVLDFYACLLHGAEEAGPPAAVDYTRRCRDTGDESDRSAAVRRLRELRSALENLPPRSSDATLTVVAENEATRSTWGRELAFVASHTVHHYALIGFLARSAGVRVPETFGVAPSTLLYWERAARAAAAR